MLTITRGFFLAFECLSVLFLISCSTTASKVQQDVQSRVVLQDLKEAESVDLFHSLLDQSSYSRLPLDASKLAKQHQEIYRALAFGESLKTQVVVRHLDGLITAVLNESSVKSLRGFFQLNIKTKQLVFSFGPDYGAFLGELTDAQYARIQKKLNEIRGHYSLSEEEPFQFYYNTSANFRMKDRWTYVMEAGDLKTYIRNKNQTVAYNRESQKHRCATDLFWVLFEMIGEERAPSEVLTP